MKLINSKITTLLLSAVAILALSGCGTEGIPSERGLSGTPTVTPPVDTTAPVIVVYGANPMEVIQGDAYIEEGASATDDVDGSVPVTITGSVDTGVAGEYTIAYTAEDSAGNIATETKTVSVIIPVLTLTNFKPADIVVGQVDMNTSDDTRPVAANTISGPYGNAHVNQGRLFLHSYSDSRVLVYNSIPTENNASADYVIGQVDLNSSDTGTGASENDGAQSVADYNGKLFVTEYSNHRITIFNTIPTENNASADIVVGQADFGESISGCTAYNLDSPETMTTTEDGKLIITDSSNNRVLIYNTIPTENNASADIVLGQNSFTTCTENDDDQDDSSDANPTARTLSFPAGVWTDGTKLVINDDSNHRVLIWNTFPTSNFQAADIVLGQSDFTMYTENDDDQDGSSDTNPTARTLNDPYDGVFSNGTQLYISDNGNNRVLVWNTFPTSNFQAADVVLGQSDFTKYTENDDDQDGVADANPTARTLNGPRGIYQYGKQLIVTDGGNDRYLIYNGQ